MSGCEGGKKTCHIKCYCEKIIKSRKDIQLSAIPSLLWSIQTHYALNTIQNYNKQFQSCPWWDRTLFCSMGIGKFSAETMKACGYLIKFSLLADYGTWVHKMILSKQDRVHYTAIQPKQPIITMNIIKLWIFNTWKVHIYSTYYTYISLANIYYIATRSG